MDTEKIIVTATGLNPNDIGGIIRHGKKAAQHTVLGLGISMVASAYDWITGRAPLSAADQKRYSDLVCAYNKLGQTIPEYWQLDDQYRPDFELNYDVLTRNLYEQSRQKIAANTPMFQAQGIMLSFLARYLESISKRSKVNDYLNGSAVRPDGVEAMFFSEMIHWILNTLPNLPESAKDTCPTILKRVSYCQEVLDLATVNRAFDAHRVNPVDTLERLTYQLDSYHARLLQKQESLNFNALIGNLSEHLLGLATQSLLMLHLLIRDANQSTLIVDQFNSPFESDKKIHQLREKKLGDWLYKTLQLAGIGTNSSTFESQKIMSLQAIVSHLDGEHPNDEECLLSPELKDAAHAQWGHWEFATSSCLNKPKTFRDRVAGIFNPKSGQVEELDEPTWIGIKARNYLSQIRELHRSTLQLYYIRQNLVRTALVSAVFGEIWIYGDPVGKAVLDELLTAVMEVTTEYNQLFDAFWKNYFIDDYKIYSKAKKENDSSFLCHRWLTEINREIQNKIKTNTDNITGTVNSIRIQSLLLPQRLEEADKSKKELFCDLLAFLRLKGKESTANYQIIYNALHTLELAPPMTDVSIAVEKLQKAVYEKARYELEQANLVEKEVTRRMEQFLSNQPEIETAIEQYKLLIKEEYDKQKTEQDRIAAEWTQRVQEKMIADGLLNRETAIKVEVAQVLKNEEPQANAVADEAINPVNLMPPANPAGVPGEPSELMQELRKLKQAQDDNNAQFNEAIKMINNTNSIFYTPGLFSPVIQSLPKQNEAAEKESDNNSELYMNGGI